MTESIRVALVGYGYWGPNLARNFHEMQDAELAWICDINTDVLPHAARRYPTARTTDEYARVIASDVDAVAIATPARTHYALAREALEANKHVFVEKPLTMSSGEAEHLIALAEARGRVLMVGHVFEYNPAVRTVKRLLEAGALGDLYYVYSTRVNLGRVQSDINALWSIAPHDISILLYLLGEMPVEVSARGGTYLNGTVEDVVFLDLRFPNGVLAHVHASWLDPSKVRQMTLVGSKRMVVYDDVASEGKVKVYDKGVYRKQAGVYGEFQYKVHSGDIHIPRIELVEPLWVELEHFVACVRAGERPLTDGYSGLRVVRVLEAAQASLAQQGAVVRVEAMPA